MARRRRRRPRRARTDPLAADGVERGRRAGRVERRAAEPNRHERGGRARRALQSAEQQQAEHRQHGRRKLSVVRAWEEGGARGEMARRDDM